ncbi:MAG: hypothetical protein KC425_14505 [Anaerolineales bacterium]|nr:hypothetical protein [Anaerolineales bacterium]
MDSSWRVNDTAVTPQESPAATWRAFLSRARWLWLPVTLFVATRVGIALVAYLAVPLIAESASPPPYHLRGTDNVLLDVFGSRWDTGFYVSIVEEGYVYEADPFPSVPFFPLLPLLMRAALPLTGDAVVAGILVSNLALLLAAILFYHLVLAGWGTAVADRAVWYLLIFPSAFFGSAIYTESLFLLTAIGALYSARRGRWWLAGLFGMAAALTRLVGIIVLPMLLAEWLLQRGGRGLGVGIPTGRERPSWRALPSLGLIPLGTLSYMAYLWQRFGDPLGFVTGSAAWERVPQSPLLTIGELLTPPAEGWWAALLAGRLNLNDWIDLLLVLGFLAAGFVLLYRHRWSEGIFVWLGVFIPFSSGLLMSQRRYMWVLFPVFILLAQWGRRPWVDRLVTAVSLSLLALFTALFANGYWVG